MLKAIGYNLRNCSKSKLQSSIAVIGLILGWSCFISIGMFLYKEMTFDQFHQKFARIYRVTYNEKIAPVPGNRHLGTVGPTVGPAMKEDFPEVEKFVRFRYSPDWLVRFNAAQFYENSVWYADSSIFKVFDFPLKEGNMSTALTLPNSVVITKAISSKYFGNQEAIGKTLTMNNEEYRVTGVLDEIPVNSHIHFDFLLPFHAFRVPYGYPVTMQDWGWIAFHNYVLLKPGSDVKAAEAKLIGLARAHFSPNGVKKFKFELQPLKDIYFGDAKDENIAEGNTTYLLVLALSAVMIILTAGFNFANLFSAMSIVRAKEVGVRKMLGATKHSLALNINGSAILLALFTLIAALFLLPIWINIVPWSISFNNFSVYELISGFLILILLAFLIGLGAGLYPFLLLSGFHFQHLLKGSFKVSKKGIFLRQAMLIGQFVISISLLSSVLIISRQMNYLKKIDLGYAKNELLLVHMPGDMVAPKYEQLRNRLSENPNVSSVSLAGGRLDIGTGGVPIFTESTGLLGEPMSILSVSFDFFSTAGIRIVQGREFTHDRSYDTLTGVILNESAAQALGWTPKQAIGKKIRVGGIVLAGEVMGVVRNFNFSSLHNPIAPLVLYYPHSHIEDIYIRFKDHDLSQMVASIGRDWNAVLPSLPFDFIFMNDHLSSLYRTDTLFEKMFDFFSVMAILIACLGFYGLLSQDIIYRVKEIAVRKVLGAASSRISLLLLKQYLLLLGIAILISWPASYYGMRAWLNSFPYRQPVQWFVFPVAGLVFLLLSILSVSYLTTRAASSNPVKSLRT